MKRIYTAESVTSGHPDKLADLIADSILDECLSQDSESRVACEVMLSYDKCILAGEITTKAKVDYIEIAKEVIKNVGYDETSIEYESRIHKQSTDINNAVSKNEHEQGAGDQGIVYGYAIKETDSFMPLPITLANRTIRRLEEVRRKNIIEGLLPDGKSQVSIEYDDEKIIGIKSIIISAQHKKSKNVVELKQEIKNLIIDYVFEDYDLTNTEILINPSGRFVLGGFKADTGLTGKINIDGEYKVGGIIGNISGNTPVIQGLKIIGTDDSYIYGTDQKYKDTNNFGGIIGFGDVTNAIIDDCCTDIKITGVTSGGIIGSIVGSNITISNCVVYNDVEDLESTITGGIIGARFTNFTINNCYFLGNVITGANNDYGDVIIGKYGKNVIIDSNNIFYANKNDKIFNSLNAIRQDYQQIIDMLSDNLKIDEND